MIKMNKYNYKCTVNSDFMNRMSVCSLYFLWYQKSGFIQSLTKLKQELLEELKKYKQGEI